LIREDFAGAGIDQDFQPVHIVGAVFLMVAESFYAREILETLSEGVLEGLIDSEIVRVAMYVDYRSLESYDLVAQGD
jgi:hypothetical protein